MVKCRICGKEFRAITWKHLHFKHKLTITEYRKMGYRVGNERDCPICGKVFIPNNREQQTCGAKCGYALRSQGYSRENHPRWGKAFKHTEEAKRKMSQNHTRFWLGKKRPNLGKKIAAKLKGRPNLALKGRKFPERSNMDCYKTCIGREPWNKGKEMPPEYGKKVSEAMHATPGAIKRGPDNPAWRGGPRPIDEKRRSDEYKAWRTAVFQRDQYTCQICGQIGGKLVAHHVKDYIDFPESRFDIDNGTTLCRADHSRLHNSSWFAAKYPHLYMQDGKPYRQLILPGL